MWFEHLVPTPRELPDVPMRLGDCVRVYRSGAVRIDVHVRAGKGWRKLDALHLEDGDEDVDPRTIAGWVRVCAEHHAALANTPGKYRAMVWRYFGGELERRKAAFDVTLTPPAPPPRPERPRARERCSRGVRRTLLETRMMLEEITAMGEPLPFAPRRDPRATVLERVMRELAGMAERFDEALTSGTVDDIDRTDFQIRWDVALLRGQEDGDIWTAMAPTIDACLDERRKGALAKRKAEADVGSPATTAAGTPTEAHASEPGAGSTEGAPPSSGDAPSARTDWSWMAAFDWLGSEPRSRGGSTLE